MKNKNFCDFQVLDLTYVKLKPCAKDGPSTFSAIALPHFDDALIDICPTLSKFTS